MVCLCSTCHSTHSLSATRIRVSDPPALIRPTTWSRRSIFDYELLSGLGVVLVGDVCPVHLNREYLSFLWQHRLTSAGELKLFVITTRPQQNYTCWQPNTGQFIAQVLTENNYLDRKAFFNTYEIISCDIFFGQKINLLFHFFLYALYNT